MRFSQITSPSFVDGPGKRAVLFTVGCSHRCPGCQNAHMWDPAGGHDADAQTLAALLAATDLPVTISGGEPFDQAADLATLLYHLRERAPFRHVILYTGYTFEELARRMCREPAILQALALADVLVDGPYIQEQDNDWMQYRGSANQRVIDLQATLTKPAYEVWFNSGPVLLDWDIPEFIITDDGDLLGASALVESYGFDSCAARRCGETA